MKRGLFITFEGGEATGKSTQIALLEKALKKLKFKVFVTREPGGTALGEKIRTLLKTDSMCPLAELLLFEASRAHLVETELKPRLKRGEIILCDRFAESSIVYQGVARNLKESFVKKANAFATQGLNSEFIILLHGQKARTRMIKRGGLDRFERERQSFHSKISKAYLQLAKKDRRFRLYSADLDRQEIHKVILKDIKYFMKKRGLLPS